MPRNSLTITPTPFKSSRLAIPPSPFSPKYPVTPEQTHSPPTRRPAAPSPARSKASSDHLSPPPPDPLHWLWQCHMCNRVYQLGVTRRCLDDGHLFCAGTTTIKRSRRTKQKIIRHKACASEFDYQGWKAWGTWRRNVVEQMEVAEKLVEGLEDDSDEDEDMLTSLTMSETLILPDNLALAVPREARWFSGSVGAKPVKNCWAACDYPSECRWGKRYGVQTPVAATTSPKKTNTTTSAVPAALTPVSPPDKKPNPTFDDILIDTPASHDPEKAAQGSVSSIPETTTGVPEAPSSPTKIVSMDDLLESAKRRKRRSSGAPPSPLSSHPPAPAKAWAAADVREGPVVFSGGLQKAFDDFELDVRKGLERAGSVVASWASGMRSSSALGAGMVEMQEMRGEAVVRGLRVNKKKGVVV